MQVVAEIRQGERTVMEYLTKPSDGNSVTDLSFVRSGSDLRIKVDRSETEGIVVKDALGASSDTASIEYLELDDGTRIAISSIPLSNGQSGGTGVYELAGLKSR